MSRLTRNGTAEPVSRDQVLRRERGQEHLLFSCPFSWPWRGFVFAASMIPPRRFDIYSPLTERCSEGLDVCVCVFFPSILDIKFVGRTSRGHTGGRSHRIFNPPSFCGACLDFCREKDSAIPFPRRPWSRILCTNELIVLHPLGIFILVF